MQSVTYHFVANFLLFQRNWSDFDDFDCERCYIQYKRTQFHPLRTGSPHFFLSTWGVNTL